MEPESMAVLRTTRGEPVPLQRVRANGRLEGLVFELTIEQHYRNTGSRNLEAIFTFPLPLHAVLLGVEFEIGDRKFAAVAFPRGQATERYEKAIDAGDAAALVEHQDNGLYTVTLGNLKPGESAAIRYRYAELLAAHGQWLRLRVPTVVAPRYGDPADAGLDAVTTPDVDLFAEYPFDIRIEIAGLPEGAWVRSTTHRIDVNRAKGRTIVTLARRGTLDRDLVIEIDEAAVPHHALIAPDGDGWVLVATPTLKLDAAEQRPLALKVLLDCSGSMAGDSIAAAKRALHVILDQLQENDEISLTCFGTRFEHHTFGLVTATDATLHRLATELRSIDATLGGTEMAKALKAVLDQPVTRGRRADVILITDGEIHAIRDVVQLAAGAGQRLFAIAIGAAPVEALARALADRTGGACEFVSPYDDAEAAILRTFHRLRTEPREIADITWPCLPEWTATPQRAMFANDTVPLFARFKARPEGSLSLNLRTRAGERRTVRCDIAETRTLQELLPRLAAAGRLPTLTAAAAATLAVRYQLATEYTSFVVVAKRAEAEKTTELPTTIKIPHMLAAGWGGVGDVLVTQFAATPPRLRYSSANAAPSRPQKKAQPSLIDRVAMVGRTVMGKRGRPGLQKQAAGSLQGDDRDNRSTPFIPEYAGTMLELELETGRSLPDTYTALKELLVLDQAVMKRLRELEARGTWNEAEIIAGFLLWIIEAAIASDSEEHHALERTRRQLLQHQHRSIRGAVAAVRRAVMNEDGLSLPTDAP